MTSFLQYQYQAAQFPPNLPSARQARQFVRAGLDDAGLVDPVLTDRLALITSELVTNAVLHGEGDIEVHLVIDCDDVWIEVMDDSPRRPQRSPPSAGDTSGRGLVLVDALVDSWGVADVSGGPGKMIWTRVSRG